MSEWFFRNSGRFTALLLAALFVAHGFAIAISGYYYYSWLDIVMHFWGGATVGLFFIWFFYFAKRGASENVPVCASSECRQNTKYYSGRLPAKNWPRPIFLLLIVSFGALIGVGWELFEFCFDTFVVKRTHWPPAQLGLADTMGDLFMDLLGAAFVGIIFAFSKVWRVKNIQ